MSSRKQKNKKAYREKRASHLARKRRERVLFQLEGTVKMTREGSCYVSPDRIEDIPSVGADERNAVTEVYVKAVKAHGALHGDRVVVDVRKLSPRAEGVITSIVERSPRPFIGFLHVVGKQAWVLMQSKVMPYDIALTSVPRDAHQGWKVAVMVDDWPRGENNPIGHIVDVLGPAGENDTEMHAILSEFGLPYRFEPELEKAADRIPDKITEHDVKSRRDFRDVLTFTIDPADAKDFDDALSYRLLPDGNVEVGVHIADVTHYVRPGSAIDKEAQERATSVYLVDRTVPMLPEKLSNKLCSLRPDEEKLCFSAVFELDARAKVVKKWFGRTVIRSDHRYDYDQAQAVLMSKAKDGTDLEKAVRHLWKLADKLRKERFRKGAISFERPEMKVVCDEKGRPVDVIQKVSFEANWLIEEFMLLANRSVAEFVALQCQNKPFVYRIHDEPNQEKLENLGTFVKNFGYKFTPEAGGDRISKALNELFAQAKDSPELSAIELMSLRCMAKAKYDVDNIGHYGLAFKYYTHFTSPIRRYPDMMVHRLLSRYLDNGSGADKDYYAGLCKHCSEREQVAADAERASIKYKLVEYMQDKLGYTFEGTVSGLTSWGMYVEVLPTHIEGLVPLREIRSDFFEFDEKRYILRGRRTRKTYTMGSKVKIRVIRTNLDQKIIDYELVED